MVNDNDYFEIIYGMMQNTPNFITVLDTEGIILYINQSISILSIDEIVGSKMLSLIMPIDHDIFKATLNDAITSKKIKSCLFSSINYKIYISYIKPIVSQGEVSRIIMYSLDITELNEERSELKNRIHYLNQFIEQIPETVITTNDEGIITDIRGKGRNIFGFNRQELIGEDLSIILKKHNFSDIKEIVEQNGIFTGEIETISKYGKDLITQFSLNNLYNTDGEVLGKIGIFIDITEKIKEEERRKKLEARVLRQQYLENLGLMAGGIAHNLNNQLMGILGYVEILSHLSKEKKDIMGYLNELKEITSSASILANQLLSYSGEYEFKSEVIDLNSHISSFESILFKLIPENISFEIKIDDEIPPVKVDINQINQILINLIKNSVEAIVDEGEIIMIISYYARTDYHGVLRFIIKDNGKGMDDEMLDKAFIPFYTTKFVGRGLGLSVIDAIVQRFDGEIKVDSKKNQGTTFEINIPVEVGTPFKKSQIITNVEKKNIGLNKVLIVDDEKMIRKVLSIMLKHLGCQSITAVDGLDCLSKYEEYKDEIDIIIMDIFMPNMNGIDALKILKEKNTEVRIILISGYTDYNINEFLEEGYIDFLHKPFTENELKSKIFGIIKK